MSNTMARRDFYRWITSLNHTDLDDVDKRLLQLLVDKFDIIAPLSTARGSRPKKIGELIESELLKYEPQIPSIATIDDDMSKMCRQVTKFEVGPFRGFSKKETFAFDKKYVLMYGPNGSGKSSFCEGFEYALLDSIEEAESKRVDLSTYCKNAQTNRMAKPIIYGLTTCQTSEKIESNQDFYRFNFVEKNRIDGFARISATAPKEQQSRIATLFGLDAFNDFVNGFTDALHGNHLMLENQKQIEFNKRNQSYETSKIRIKEIDAEIAQLKDKKTILISEFTSKEISTLDDLRVFLTGEDGMKGIIGELLKEKLSVIPQNIVSDIVVKINDLVSELEKDVQILEERMIQYEEYATDVSFKDLFTAIEQLSNDVAVDKGICPACRTQVDKVVTNPFDFARSEISKMSKLADVQTEIEQSSQLLVRNVQSINKLLNHLKEIQVQLQFKKIAIPLFIEEPYSGIKSAGSLCKVFKLETNKIKRLMPELQEIENEIIKYNDTLQKRREKKSSIEADLQKYQKCKETQDEIVTLRKKANQEKVEIQKSIKVFEEKNKTELDEIEKINKLIELNIKSVQSYAKLITKLKEFREYLPLSLASGLSEKACEYYNIINSHDPEFECLKELNLPTSAGGSITLCFMNESTSYDALYILSEGHIKILGISILMSKIANDNLGFIIFDDIVNAIDDDHRDGIAELLINSDDLKNRQHIITSHGELFISKLEQKLGTSRAAKEVIKYRFNPSDTVDERGVKFTIGNTGNYILLAKQYYSENALKDAAARCRQAIESITERLWKKMSNTMNLSLNVLVRNPGSRPDLFSVVDGLIKALLKISGSEELIEDLKSLKENYSWNLLNKGTHEQGDLPEFERTDIKVLIEVVEKIDKAVSSINLEIKTK